MNEALERSEKVLASEVDNDSIGKCATKLINIKGPSSGFNRINFLYDLDAFHSVTMKEKRLLENGDDLIYNVLLKIINLIKDEKLKNEILEIIRKHPTFSDDVVAQFISFSSAKYIAQLCVFFFVISGQDKETTSVFFDTNVWSFLKERIENPDAIYQEKCEEKGEEEEYVCLSSSVVYTIRSNLLMTISNLVFDELFDFELLPEILNSVLEWCNMFDDGLKRAAMNSLDFISYKTIEVIVSNNYVNADLIEIEEKILLFACGLFKERQEYSENCMKLYITFLLLGRPNDTCKEMLIAIIELLKKRSNDRKQSKAMDAEEDEEGEFDFDDSIDMFDMDFVPEEELKSEEIDFLIDERRIITSALVSSYKIDELHVIMLEAIDWNELWDYMTGYSDENDNEFVQSMCRIIEIDPSQSSILLELISHILAFTGKATLKTMTLILKAISITSENFTPDIFKALLQSDFMNECSSLALTSGENAYLYATLFLRLFNFIHSTPSCKQIFSGVLDDVSTLEEITEEDDEDFEKASEIASIILSEIESSD